MRAKIISMACALALAGCGGDGGGSGSVSIPTPSPTPTPTPAPATYTIGGAVSGLTGSGLTLRNGSETVTLAAGATSFAFTTTLVAGAGYAVSIGTQPSSPAQTCTIANASGTVASANVATVAVACKTDPSVYVYVLRRGASLFDLAQIATLSLDPDANTLVSAGTPLATSCLTSITANRQNRLVLTTQSRTGTLGSPCSGTFEIAPIDAATGLPDRANRAAYSESAYPAQAIIHPNGTDFYILRANATETVVVDPAGAVAPYRFDTTGLTATATGPAVPVGTAPRAGAIDRGATRLIVSDQGSLQASGNTGPGDLRVLDITNPQQPAALSTYTGVTAPYAVVTSPVASYVYVSSASGTTGYALSLGATGILTPVGSGTFTTPGGVHSMAIGASGTTLYAVGYDSATIQAYTIGSTGTPTALGAALATGSLPVSVTVDPTGRHVMVLNRGTANSSISLYTIGGTGALTAVAGSPFDIGTSLASGFVALRLR